MNENLRQLLGLPIKTPLEYWIKYWEHYIRQLENKKEIDIGLTGPRLILEELVAEVQYNNDNKRNKEFFRTQIIFWKNEDKAFGHLFSQELHELLQNYSDNVRIQALCSTIIEKMNQGFYFDSLLNNLQNVVSSAKDFSYTTKCKINRYTELVISEFVAHNFSLSDIGSLPKHLPTIICEEGGHIVIAPDEYWGLKISDYQSEEEYHTALEKVIGERSLLERVEEIRQYFHKDKGDFLVLIAVNGIKGQVDFTIDGVNFYSPSLKKYINDNTFNELETDENANIRVLAAISVKDCSPQTAIGIASNRLQKVLGVMTTYLDPYLPFTYNEKEIAVLKDGSPVVFSMMSIHKNFEDPDWKRKHDYYLSMNASKITENIQEVNKRCRHDSSPDNTSQMLSSAIYWYKRGRETEKGEDKLLYSWIAIEGMLSVEQSISDEITSIQKSLKIELIQFIVEAVVMKSRFYNSWRMMYYNLRQSIYYNENFYDISEEAISRTGLMVKAGEKIPRSSFINGLSYIEKTINDEVKKNEIHKLSSFYKNKNGFNRCREQLQNDILMIYHLRNLLVHNAYCPQNIVDIYARKASFIAESIICKLQAGYAETSMSINELLMEVSTQYKTFLTNLDSEINKLKIDR